MDAVGAATSIDLSRAAIVVRPGEREAAETMAATIFADEVKTRTGIALAIQNAWPRDDRAVIAITTRDGAAPWSKRLPRRDGAGLPETKPEGYAIRVQPGKSGSAPTVFVIGADGRGAMFGAGRLLRNLHCASGALTLDASFDIATAPVYPIRGHQLGYRAHSNTYDAWTPEHYEQYIRELIVFGTNSVEAIPYQDQRHSPLMKLSREAMNLALSGICAKYDIDLWVWAPASFDLNDQTQRASELELLDKLYRTCPRISAIFFPGGDPGDNPPQLVIPYLEDSYKLLVRHHPNAKIWVSLQKFDPDEITYFFNHVVQHKPKWLGGLVSGPSSPDMRSSRARLPKQYRHRWYPDITHTMRCQYPVEWWDPAFAFTLGREPTNPRPMFYSTMYRQLGPYTDGFATYSDGINDDFNKALWSTLGWDPNTNIREILVEYARFFFSSDVDKTGADALLGLENNFQGPLAENAGVDGVLALWQRLETRHPELLKQWRFQIHLMRAYYDAYMRHRLLFENGLEAEALRVLGRAAEIGADRAMDEAQAVFARADTETPNPQWRARIEKLGETAFKAIGYQTSVERFQGSGANRGCVLDFLSTPLNNRVWTENEFTNIRKLTGETEKIARLDMIRTWENPGPGSYYDNVGHPGKSPHVVRGENDSTDPSGLRHDNPGHAVRDNHRVAWRHYMRWPPAMFYESLDREATYTLRVTGQGHSPVRADGVRLVPSKYSTNMGEFKEFPIPTALTRDGQVRLTWDEVDEEHMNWRQHSHVAEVWLLKDASAEGA
jgi:hypothetical protein